MAAKGSAQIVHKLQKPSEKISYKALAQGDLIQVLLSELQTCVQRILRHFAHMTSYGLLVKCVVLHSS